MAHRVRPLWQKRIPKYPLYWKGDPQLRVLLPQFWMKIVKPKRKVPPYMVHFEVHPQMSKFDIKQYLEKIYKVPVVRVDTEVREGKHFYDVGHQLDDHGEREDKGAKAIGKEDDLKYAYVQLDESYSFTYPETLVADTTEADTSKAEVEKGKEKFASNEAEQWDRRSLPPWFR